MIRSAAPRPEEWTRRAETWRTWKLVTFDDVTWRLCLSTARSGSTRSREHRPDADGPVLVADRRDPATRLRVHHVEHVQCVQLRGSRAHTLSPSPCEHDVSRSRVASHKETPTTKRAARTG